MFQIDEYKRKLIDFKSFLELFKNGDSIFIHSGAAEPYVLLQMLSESNLVDLDFYQLYSIRNSNFSKEKLFENHNYRNFFVSEESKSATHKGIVDYVPINLSQIPLLFDQHRIALDFALIQVSKPDNNGFFSLGTNVDISKSAVKNAMKVVAQVNFNMPRTLGDSFIHLKDIDYIIEHDSDLLEFNQEEEDFERALKAAENAATIVDNFSTIQIGFGNTTKLVIKMLLEHRGLGVHSEIFYDDFVDLIRNGNITCNRKTLNTDKVIVSFVHGSKKSYEFIDNNPFVEFHPVDYTNNPQIISQNKNFISINSAFEVDLSGQVNAEAIGYKIESGIGGFVEFNFGATFSRGGKSIIVLPSISKDGKKSRIVPEIKEGFGVTLSKANVHYIVTEFGLAYLFGKTLRERALALISIAHPDFREELFDFAKKKGIIPSNQIMPLMGTNYPKQYETYFTTKSGIKLFVRPLKSEDEDNLRRLLYSYSLDKIYQRFFCFIRDFTHERTQCMVNINYDYDMALGCFFEDELVATAGYFYDSSEHIGEIAFMVKKEYQGYGIATFLNDYLKKIAEERGLRGFKAYVLRQNSAMLNVFHKSGYQLKVKDISDMNIFELELYFEYKKQINNKF
jgi:acyl-CoA hydrolase/RimJ/RimL family protein N-acetyltransferase